MADPEAAEALSDVIASVRGPRASPADRRLCAALSRTLARLPRDGDAALLWWAVQHASTWSGSMMPGEDQDEFDRKIRRARVAVRRMRGW